MPKENKVCDIEILHIHKQFKDYKALDDVCLHIFPNEFVALLGPSGSGKTTLLRIIAGLEFPDSGSILLNGREVHREPISQRNIGFVFQHYALFKHMTVLENVAFGLRVRQHLRHFTEQQILDKVMELLHLIHMDHLSSRYPDQLSGGQRQRVALARVLAVEPRLLLLDEPFGSLDAKVRKDLRRWIRRLHEEIKLTSIFVTHDQEEAMEVADRIVVVNQGRIEQTGTPQEVYDFPANSFVYDFLGHYNEFLGWRDELGTLHILKPSHSISLESVKIYVRPYDILITNKPETPDYLPMYITHINPWGVLVKIEMENEEKNKTVYAEIMRSCYEKLHLERGNKVYILPQKMKAFG